MNPRILVADDDTSTAVLLQMLFDIEGYEVDIVDKYEEVVSVINSKKPDVLILDYNLIDTTATEILHKMKRAGNGHDSEYQPAREQAMAVSGYAEDETIPNRRNSSFTEDSTFRSVSLPEKNAPDQQMSLPSWLQQDIEEHSGNRLNGNKTVPAHLVSSDLNSSGNDKKRVIPHLPVIVTSGMDVEEEVVGAGAVRFFSKPYDVSELLNAVRKVLPQ